MGRRPWSDRLTVEECQVLEIASLVEGWMFYSTGKFVSQTFSWTGGFEVCATYFTSDGTLRLSFGFPWRWTRYQDIEVTSIPSPLGRGKRRFYFLCPECRERVGSLYLPPGAGRFACRSCYNLTYRSCKEHDKRVDALRRSSVDLFRALGSPRATEPFRALKASLDILEKILEKDKKLKR